MLNFALLFFCRAMNRHDMSEWKSKLKVRQTFDSFQELKGYFIDHGVQKGRIITTYKKDKTRYLAHCKMNDTSVDDVRTCNWRIQTLREKKTGVITITKVHTDHTC